MFSVVHQRIESAMSHWQLLVRGEQTLSRLLIRCVRTVHDSMQRRAWRRWAKVTSYKRQEQSRREQEELKRIHKAEIRQLQGDFQQHIRKKVGLRLVAASENRLLRAWRRWQSVLAIMKTTGRMMKRCITAMMKGVLLVSHTRKTMRETSPI